MEDYFLAHKDFISFLATATSVAVVIVGWFFNSAKARKLQRKQLAIQILHDNRYEQVWVDNVHYIIKFTREDGAGHPDWVNLAKDAYSKNRSLSEEHDKIWGKLRSVLNTFEFLSIAVLNRAVDEEIIRWSYEYYYNQLYETYFPYIQTIRDISNDPDLYVNFTTMVYKWDPSKKPKVGEAARST